MSDGTARRPGRAAQHWLLWWRIDDQELARQAAGYRTLGVFKSARGVSTLCLVFALAITLGFMAVRALPLNAIVDVMIMGALAVFVYFGHRWAIIGAMVAWTFEKVAGVYGSVTGASPNGVMLIVNVVWWCAYMHAFYLALKVEQRRRQPGGTLADPMVFD